MALCKKSKRYVCFFLQIVSFSYVQKLTRLHPVTLADDDALLRVGDVHTIVLDRYNVGPTPAKARILFYSE